MYFLLKVYGFIHFTIMNNQYKIKLFRNKFVCKLFQKFYFFSTAKDLVQQKNEERYINL